ncbi:hypothetical protein RB595_007053 [Gaeumannomyces hyphopodioides]
MSRLPPDAAIFSPSVARAAASAAKDWSYIDAWLASRFRGRPAPPRFERNADTLRALLALAALNESADEQRDLLAAVEADALAELEAAAAASGGSRNDDDGERDPGTDLASVRRDLLSALEAGLTRDGRASLDAMAAASVELGLAHPTPAAISAHLTGLAAARAEAEQATARVSSLRRHVDGQAARADAVAADAAGPAYRPPADLAKLNLEAQRRVRALEAALPEARDRAAAQAAAAGGRLPDPTVEQVRAEEEAYLELLHRKRALDARLRAFEGLPPDPAMARRELEARRDVLRRLTQRRDAVFEGLVERETPRKPRG